MARYPTTLTLVTAWLAMLVAFGCAPPPPAAKSSESAAKSDMREASAESDSSTSVPLNEKQGKRMPAAVPVAIEAVDAPPDPTVGDWGTITGKFKFVGEAPKGKPIPISKDGAVCGAKIPLFEEWLVVGEGGELANVVIYAMSSPEKWASPIAPIHSAYAELKKREVVLDNINCRFEPHVVAGWTQQKFLFRNSDPVIGHNVFAQPFVNRPGNPLIPTGGQFTVDYPLAERLPFRASCSIHPWMAGWILVRPDPYFAVSAKDGSFKIENLPAGDYHFQIWHESLLYLNTISFGGMDHKGKKGVHRLTIKPGPNDLGEIAVAAKDYSRQLEKLK
jgi:hypothetical protein